MLQLHPRYDTSLTADNISRSNRLTFFFSFVLSLLAVNISYHYRCFEFVVGGATDTGVQLLQQLVQLLLLLLVYACQQKYPSPFDFSWRCAVSLTVIQCTTTQQCPVCNARQNTCNSPKQAACTCLSLIVRLKHYIITGTPAPLGIRAALGSVLQQQQVFSECYRHQFICRTVAESHNKVQH